MRCDQSSATVTARMPTAPISAANGSHCFARPIGPAFTTLWRLSEMPILWSPMIEKMTQMPTTVVQPVASDPGRRKSVVMTLPKIVPTWPRISL